MTNRRVQEIIASLGGPATPRPGFKEELGERLSAELDDGDAEADGDPHLNPDAKSILRRIERRIERRALPRPQFKAELASRLDEELKALPAAAVPGAAGSRVDGLPRRLADRLKSGWWLQSAAAVVVLALVASVTTWTSCLQRESVPDRRLASGPATAGAPPPVQETGAPVQGAPDLSGERGGPAAAGTGDAEGSANPPASGGAQAAPPAPSKPKPKPPPPQPNPGAAGSGGAREMLAFSSKTGDGFWHIFTMKEDGTGRVQLTEGPAHDRGPDWSPDGKRIAFMRLDNDDAHDGKIYVINADGSGLRYLVDGGEPSWSPDGNQIVYWTETPPVGSRMWIINADGSGARMLPVSGIVGDPYWSPRGDLISFAGAVVVQGSDDSDEPGPGTTQVYTVRPDGSGLQRLTDYTWACNMSFSPDGSQIAYATTSDFISTHIWTMNADGTEKRQLTNGTGIHAYPHWSSDGKRIVFAVDPDGEPHWSFIKESVGPQPGAIWVMDADGSNRRRISPSGVDDADPVFRPGQNSR